MDTNQFKYDVAFSFLSRDEALATELNDRLQDRVKTFLYSKKQEQIAGTDGEQTFNKVFGNEARVVVLLYRKGWGETPFTRIEETAIKNRGYDHSYDFLLCIPLDEPPAAPKWFPKRNLWIGLKRWGVGGAASVIEARIQEQGGQPHEESVQERALRLKRSMEIAGRKRRFLESEAGVNAANEKFELLRSEMERLAKESGLSLSFKSHNLHFVVVGMGIGLGVLWEYHYGNSLTNAKLITGLWDGHPPLSFPNQYPVRQPSKIQGAEFTFDISASEEHQWVKSGSQARVFSTNDLATSLLKELIDQCDIALRKKERNNEW
ncbi:MAG: hypothetical protein JF609_00275 [Verrucomicrobia bacterium]|nr:hypothetical protein [Verrucomicrobiota bacterium]